MAGTRMTSAWAAPAAGAPDFLGTVYYPDDSRDAFDAYQDRRAVEGTLGSAGYWQYSSCLKDGFQSTDEAGDIGCRGGVGSVACLSYNPDRARYERQEQKGAAGVERQMSLPPAVADLVGSGYGVAEAFAKAGLPDPFDASAKRVAAPASLAEPSASLLRAGVGAGKTSRLAAPLGMAVGSAFRDGRLASAPAPSGKPAAPAGVRPDESVVATSVAPASAGLYNRPDASKLGTLWRA